MSETTYLGLPLKSPVIVGSCGLTTELENIKAFASAGAGAIVLKSLLEEQINTNILTLNTPDQHAEAYDYISHYVRDSSLQAYLNTIKQAKEATDVPIIASINCLSSTEWTSFARQIEGAGADALELNLFLAPLDIHKSSDAYEMTYLEIAQQVQSIIDIPVAIKLGSGITNLPGLAYKLKNAGVQGLVLFNKFYEPDIDINDLTFTSGQVFSEPSQYNRTLRWIGILSGLIKHLDLAASTGIHSGETAIKQILAGASTVQVVSALYQNGPSAIRDINETLTSWMKQKSFASIDAFKGHLNYAQSSEAAIYERSQFIKYYSKRS